MVGRKAAATSGEHGVVISLDAGVALVGGFPALTGVDVQVVEGEIIHVAGPNGVGKSTLLSLCAGLIPLYRGAGSVLGCDLRIRADRKRLRRLSGRVSDKSQLYRDLTVKENLLFWCRANKIDTQIIEPIMTKLGIDGRVADQRVSELSTGQRKRTSLAAVVCRRPRLWLLDEPYSGLDSEGHELLDVLIHNAVSFGATVVFTSHDETQAARIATRRIDLRGGRVLRPPPVPARFAPTSPTVAVVHPQASWEAPS